MKIILDASVAFKVAIDEADSDKARQLMQEFVGGVHDLLAPDFFPVECTHALTRSRVPNARGE